MLVSVIVPVYNTELYLEECLSSILSQTLQEIELICVDDGSTDDSPKILKEFAKNDFRVKILTQENKYAGAARNYGLSEAQGKYVVFLDSDDFFESTMLEDMYAKCEKDQAQICICNGQVYDENTRKFRQVSHYISENYLPKKIPFSRKDIPDYILNVCMVAPWNKMYQRQFLLEKKLQYQELKRANDVYFGSMAMALADRITVCNKVLVNYRSGHSSSLQANKDDSPLDFYDALVALQEGLIEHKVFNEVKKSFINYCLTGCYYNLNGVKTGEGYSKIYRKLTEEGFDRLELSGHSSGYFYRKDYYFRLLELLNGHPEIEIYDKLKSLETELENLKNGIFADERIFQTVSFAGSPKVSVIIPVYNVELYVEECVRSVMNQTLENIEIICVNDGSTDNSAKILRNLKQEDDRIQVISKKNGGQSSARNMGIERARGEYILFLDSDDLLEIDALRTLYSYAAYFDLEELFYSGTSFFESKQLEKKNSGFSTYYNYKGNYPYTEVGSNLFIKLCENGDFKPSACLQIFKREFLIKNALLFYDGILHEDDLFTLQCISLSKRARVLNRKFYKRRVRENSVMTSQKSFDHTYGRFTVALEMLKFIEAQKLYANKEFYYALMLQVSKECDSAAKDLAQIDSQEILDHVAKLDEQERSAYLLLIYHKRSMKEKMQKEADENAKNQMADLRKQISIVKGQLEREREHRANDRKNLEKTYAEKSEINAKLKKTYEEKSEINAKLKRTYEEKSELNAKLKKTYAEKSEINAKLKQAYADKTERGLKIKELETRVAELEKELQKSGEKTYISWGGYNYFKDNHEKLKDKVKLSYVYANKETVQVREYEVISKEEILKKPNPFVIISLAQDHEVEDAARWLQKHDIPYVHLSFLLHPSRIEGRYIKAVGGSYTDPNNNRISISRQAEGNITVDVSRAKDASVQIGEIIVSEKLSVELQDEKGSLQIEDGTSMDTGYVLIHADGSVKIGKNCSFAEHAEFITAEAYQLFDNKTGEKIGGSGQIEIGDDVHVGADAVFYGGAKVGDHSVVESYSVVTEQFPDHALLSGNVAELIAINEE